MMAVHLVSFLTQVTKAISKCLMMAVHLVSFLTQVTKAISKCLIMAVQLVQWLFPLLRFEGQLSHECSPFCLDIFIIL